jgi:hypothetical protein
MENLLNFPPPTIVNKGVPKNAFYGRSAQKTWLKDLLTREFESITWLYKLTAQTLNVADGEKVEEIDVFLCQMKEDRYSINPFCSMDELLPRHTMFIIEYGAHTDLLMHYKEKTVVRGEEKWKRGDTELLREVDLSKLHLQLMGTSLDSVYAGLLGQVSCLKTLSVTRIRSRRPLSARANSNSNNSLLRLKRNVEPRSSRDENTSYTKRY